MGIPGLFSRMRDAGFASVAKEIGRAEQQTRTHAIIDGPAFAHYIYRILESERAAANVPGSNTTSLVTYRECASEALRVSGLLQDHGFTV